MRVAVVSGVCVRHDAISNAVLQEREALRGAGHEVAIYCQGTTMVEDPGIFTGSDPWLMTRHEGYRWADIAILHFGTAYELFDSLLLQAPGMVRVVRFHNVTTPSLLSGVHRRRAQQGLDQVVMCERADHVWCDSEYNRRTLVALGVPEDQTSVLELCVPEISELEGRPLGAVTEPLRILFVGRLVEAKGVVDLLDAFDESGLAAENVELVLAGNASQSSPELLGDIRRRLAQSPGARVSVVESPSGQELRGLYETSSVFAMPSYHEGFCVPVVEALAHGLRIVASDAGALPETVGNSGLLVPPGDLAALVAGLRGAVGLARSEGRVSPDWPALARFSAPSFRHRFGGALAELLAATDQ